MCIPEGEKMSSQVSCGIRGIEQRMMVLPVWFEIHSLERELRVAAIPFLVGLGGTESRLAGPVMENWESHEQEANAMQGTSNLLDHFLSRRMSNHFRILGTNQLEIAREPSPYVRILTLVCWEVGRGHQ